MFMSQRNLVTPSFGGMVIKYTQSAPFVSLAQKQMLDDVKASFDVVIKNYSYDHSSVLRGFIESEATVWGILLTASESLAMIKSNRDLPNLMVKLLSDNITTGNDLRVNGIVEALGVCLAIASRNRHELQGSNPQLDEATKSKQYNEYFAHLNSCIYYLFASHPFVSTTLKALDMHEPNFNELNLLLGTIESGVLSRAFEELYLINGGKFSVNGVTFEDNNTDKVRSSANYTMTMSVWSNTKIRDSYMSMFS